MWFYSNNNGLEHHVIYSPNGGPPQPPPPSSALASASVASTGSASNSGTPSGSSMGSGATTSTSSVGTTKSSSKKSTPQFRWRRRKRRSKAQYPEMSRYLLPIDDGEEVANWYLEWATFQKMLNFKKLDRVWRYMCFCAPAYFTIPLYLLNVW